MKKLIFMLSAVIFLFTACQKEEAAVDATSATPESGFHKANPYDGPCAETFTTPMIADGGSQDFECDGIVVGYITVSKTDNLDAELNCLNITYDVTYTIDLAGWVIDATQLYIGPEDSIPASGKPGSGKRNPKIGHFEFNDQHVPGIPSYSYSKTVPCDQNTVIAAHADVRLGDPYPVPYTVEDFCEDLPDEVSINVGVNFNDSYLNIEVFDDGWLNGDYPGWCIDVNAPIDPGDSPFYKTAVYCLDEADDIVDNHGNLHLVAWVVNQHYVHTPSGCEENANYTYADVQYAIWLLVDYTVPLPDDVGLLGQAFVDALDICRAFEIIDAAELAYPAGSDPFEPACGELTVVVLDPGVDDKGEDIQKLILEFPLECDQEETAWGYGYQDTDCDNLVGLPLANGFSFTNSDYYGGKAWGWYFFGCQPPQ